MTAYYHSECEPRHIKEFAATISNQPLGLARYCPEVWGQLTRCFENVRRKVQQDGGRAQFGWMFHYRIVTDIPVPGYLIAVHHAVWYDSNGHLIDITPFHPEQKHRPLSSGGDVLFLVDDSAIPVATERLVAPRPSQFYPLSTDERLNIHVQQLIRREEQDCRQIYESSQT